MTLETITKLAELVLAVVGIVGALGILWLGGMAYQKVRSDLDSIRNDVGEMKIDFKRLVGTEVRLKELEAHIAAHLLQIEALRDGARDRSEKITKIEAHVEMLRARQGL